MTYVESSISQNKKYTENFTDGDLPSHPSRKIAILACMDARILINEAFGLKIGEAHNKKCRRNSHGRCIANFDNLSRIVRNRTNHYNKSH